MIDQASLEGVQRLDTLSKVTGKAKYTADLTFPDMHHVSVVRSPHPHARIVSIDTVAALNSADVVLVLTAADFPASEEINRPVLASSVVRYAGEGVAVVVGRTPKAARDGAEAVHVTYELLTPVLDPLEAIRPGAAAIHGDTNIASRWTIRRGDPQGALERADLRIERTYRTQAVYHGHMETETAVAVPADGGVTVYCPSKLPHIARNAVAGVSGQVS